MLYSTAQAAAQATEWRQLLSASAANVTPATIRKWSSRGHLARSGLDDHGHPLYALADIARAEKATRARALRLVDIGTPSSRNSHTPVDDHAALTP
ncbi:MerR family transcriptional regulator [Streptomyces galilaeus]